MHSLKTISDLLRGFKRNGVRYVHWKSNNNINQALDGRDDLDILVHPEDRVAAETVMTELRFIRGLSPKDQWQPNMYHYYAMESDGSQLVHLHLHYALTLGYDYHKNFTLEVLDWYLEGREEYCGIYLPQPEKEYILFVIRTLIKNARSVAMAEFPIRQLRGLLQRRSQHSNSAENELIYLRSLTDENAIRAALAASGLPFTYERFSALAAQVEHPDRTGALQNAAAEVKQALASTRQTSEGISFLLATQRIWQSRGRRVLAKLGAVDSNTKTAEFGGRIIAFIGGDGAGKSTNVSNSFKVFSRHLRTTQIHIGRPRRSFLGIGFSALAKLVRVGGGKPLSDNLCHLALAHNRLREFQRAERARQAGTIVIMDRLPHPAIRNMDAPRIQNPKAKLDTWLAAVEQRLYDRIQGVDLIVALKLDPEIACLRRPEDKREVLLERSGEIWGQDWNAAHMVTVNTGEMSFCEVERTIQNRIWKELSRPFLRLEVVGTTGAGKSTLAQGLKDELSNASTQLPYRHKFLTLLRPALQALYVTGVPKSRLQVQIWKNITLLMYFRKAYSPDALARRNPATHLVLDQGPLFQITLAEKEGVLSQTSPFVVQTLENFNAMEGIGLFLSADHGELRQRVGARVFQPTRGSKLSDGAFETFASEYEALFDTLKKNVARRIDLSSEATKDLTKARALDAIITTRDAR